MSIPGLSPDLLYVGHLLLFAIAGIACFLSVRRFRVIDDPDTRRGLVSLLILSGGWSAAHFFFIIVPGSGFKVIFYLAGLVVGFAAVGAWLYFCSAYTGRSLHRNPTIRVIAVVGFSAIIVLKLSNPLHQLYFSTEFVLTPFPHLAIHNQLLHWVAMGLSYGLAMVGYFMILELLMEVSYNTRPILVLLSITALPIILDLAGLFTPVFIDITYEPLGVAVFALGVGYFYLDQFQAIQLAGSSDDPVIVVSNDDRIRDFNRSATTVFPELSNPHTIGKPLADVLPLVAELTQSGPSVMSIDREGSPQYYQITTNQFGAGRENVGRLISLTNVTHREQYRQELERQNQRLDRFASMVSHDLRNPLTVAQGRLELAREAHENEHLVRVADAHARMWEIIEDMLDLARYGQPVEDTETVELPDITNQSWQMVQSDEATVTVDGDFEFQADIDRVHQLFENLFRNAIDHAGSDVTIHVGPLPDEFGFYVEDNGPGISEQDLDKVFEFGYTTAEDGTGFGLAIVEEIANAHGWSIRVSPSNSGGARFEFVIEQHAT